MLKQKISRILILTLFGLFLFIGDFVFLSSAAFAIEENKISFDEALQDEVERAYVAVDEAIWEKYFQEVSCIIKKQWRPKKAGLRYGYKDAYVRLLFFVDKEGELVSYEVKGTCLPVDDKAFLTYVKETVEKGFKFNPLPDNYNADYIVFTTEIHFKLFDSSRLQWIPKRYGAALVQIADNTRKFQIQEVEE